MFHWFTSKEEFQGHIAGLRPMSLAAEAHLLEKEVSQGWCGICQKLSTLSVSKPPEGEWCNLRECILCDCGLNGRMREVFEAFKLALQQDHSRKFLMLEQVTPFFSKVREHYPFVEGCEYLGDDVPEGSFGMFGEHSVRSENILRLSYDDHTYDLVFHGDILEHVPDSNTALRECWRILKPGGVMVFTCPFFDLDEHIVRARVVDGKIEHALPPSYHGNPLKTEGSLVYYHHGWPLLTDILNAGFSKAYLGLFYDVFQGIVSNNNPYPEGHMWPVIFYAIK